MRRPIYHQRRTETKHDSNHIRGSECPASGLSTETLGRDLGGVGVAYGAGASGGEGGEAGEEDLLKRRVSFDSNGVVRSERLMKKWM